jgi:hypothetical protein
VGDSKQAGSRNTATSKANPGVSLTDWSKQDGGQGRKGGGGPRLCPRFVEWLMGWPNGAVRLQPSETAGCPSAPPKRGSS